jgi:hypothetical protein
MLVQALFPESGVERLDKWVIRWGPGSAECQFDAAAMSPLIQGFRGELRPIIDKERLRQSMCRGQPVQHSHYTLATQGSIDLERWTLTGHVIDAC